VFASTFDETPRRHAQVADLVIARAQRLVELDKHVILLLDSLTRLARGHNSAMQGGPIGSGGVSPAALQKSRKFFGTARNIENGGSLTILATALVETESRLDDVVFEEFKGTGNMEVRLDRELAERRVYPAIHIPQSGTRNDDPLYHPDEFLKVVDLRRQLAGLPIGDAIETLLTNLKGTKTNAELLLRGLTHLDQRGGLGSGVTRFLRLLQALARGADLPLHAEVLHPSLVQLGLPLAHPRQSDQHARLRADALTQLGGILGEHGLQTLGPCRIDVPRGGDDAIDVLIGDLATHARATAPPLAAGLRLGCRTRLVSGRRRLSRTCHEWKQQPRGEAQCPHRGHS
jgi:hypothetical protein